MAFQPSYALSSFSPISTQWKCLKSPLNQHFSLFPILKISQENRSTPLRSPGPDQQFPGPWPAAFHLWMSPQRRFPAPLTPASDSTKRFGKDLGCVKKPGPFKQQIFLGFCWFLSNAHFGDVINKNQGLINKNRNDWECMQQFASHPQKSGFNHQILGSSWATSSWDFTQKHGNSGISCPGDAPQRAHHWDPGVHVPLTRNGFFKPKIGGV